MSPLLAAVASSLAPVPPAPPPVREPRSAAVPDPVLDALRSWRRSAAAAARMPEPAICPDAQLVALAESRPTSMAEVESVLGPLAARRLGPRVLQVVASVADVSPRPRAAR
jgi:ribonuclease D